MAKVKIAYGGGRFLGVQVLKWLSSQDEFEIVAVCPVPYKYDPEYYDQMMEIVRNNHYLVCDINELKDMAIDIGLSVNYHRIIEENILNHCRKGFYNVHHSYNLRLRGRNITTHVLLNTLDEKIHYHGTTLHRMVPELDAGGIVASQAISIMKTDTAYTLFKKIDMLALDMLKEWIPRLAFENVVLYEPPEEMVHKYKNSDLPSREIKESMPNERIDVIIRAFDFPGKEPAFIMRNGKQIHLVYTKRDKYQRAFEINGNLYYAE